MALFDKISQIDDNATDRIIEYIGTHAGDVMPTAWQCLCLLVAIYLIVMALWTGKIALRYGNMTLRMTDNLLTIESGLVSRFTCRLAREKTTVLTIKRNPLEKIAGCQTISLHQAENATDSKNEGGIRIYGSNLGDELLAWWLGNNGSVNDTTLLSAASGIGLLMRTFIPHLLLAVGGAALIMISTKLALAAVMQALRLPLTQGECRLMCQPMPAAPRCPHWQWTRLLPYATIFSTAKSAQARQNRLYDTLPNSIIITRYLFSNKPYRGVSPPLR